MEYWITSRENGERVRKGFAELIDVARKQAVKLAIRDQQTMFIERIDRKGRPKVVEEVHP